jgi:Uri superfamily endonuclease
MLESRPGSYVLWLTLAEAHRLQIGQLGTTRFEAGFYAYVGSALGPGGVRARVGRHLLADKARRWHIDYLRAAGEVQTVWLTYDHERHEHHWAAVLYQIHGSVIPLCGFGSSDCDCNSHLVRFTRMPTLERFRRRLGRTAPSLQSYSPNL